MSLNCLDAADTDDNGTVETIDAISIMRYLFLRGPAPPHPSTSCGIDTTADSLDCDGGVEICR